MNSLFKSKKGYEGSFFNILTGLILVGLFGTLLLLAVTNMGNDYSMDTSKVVGGSLAFDKFNSSIANVSDKAQEIKTAFEVQSLWSAIAGVVVTGMFGIGKDMAKLLLSPFGLIQDLLIDILGVPAFVTNIILGLFIFAVMIAIWRLIRIGE